MMLHLMNISDNAEIIVKEGVREAQGKGAQGKRERFIRSFVGDYFLYVSVLLHANRTNKNNKFSSNQL